MQASPSGGSRCRAVSPPHRRPVGAGIADHPGDVPGPYQDDSSAGQAPVKRARAVSLRRPGSPAPSTEEPDVTFTQPTHPIQPTQQRANVPQLMLPGQAAAPEGPVDATAMYVMHHAFRRDLAAFAAAVPVTPVDDRATWRRLRQRWELFATGLPQHPSGGDG